MARNDEIFCTFDKVMIICDKKLLAKQHIAPGGYEYLINASARIIVGVAYCFLHLF